MEDDIIRVTSTTQTGYDSGSISFVGSSHRCDKDAEIAVLRAEIDRLKQILVSYTDKDRNAHARNVALLAEVERLKGALAKIKNIAHLAWTSQKTVIWAFEEIEALAGGEKK